MPSKKKNKENRAEIPLEQFPATTEYKSQDKKSKSTEAKSKKK